MTTDNFCSYLQNRLIQTSQTGGQHYSDTSHCRIPWLNQYALSHSGHLLQTFKLAYYAPIVNYNCKLPVTLGAVVQCHKHIFSCNLHYCTLATTATFRPFFQAKLVCYSCKLHQ
jgi:hypothetical protein